MKPHSKAGMLIISKPPNLEHLQNEMIQLSHPLSQELIPSKKKDIYLSSPPLGKLLKSNDEFILQPADIGDDLRTFDDRTFDARTVISKDLSRYSDDKSLKPTPNVKSKTIARKSNISAPGQKPLTQNIFQTQEKEGSPEKKQKENKIDGSEGKKVPEIVDRAAPQKKSIAKGNEAYNQINDVYHPQFSFDKYKTFLFSKEIKNKHEFQKFLKEIKTDVSTIKMISLKEACPDKVMLVQLDRSRSILKSKKDIVP